jgi:hypothetical protein
MKNLVKSFMITDLIPAAIQIMPTIIQVYSSVFNGLLLLIFNIE